MIKSLTVPTEMIGNAAIRELDIVPMGDGDGKNIDGDQPKHRIIALGVKTRGDFCISTPNFT